MQLSFFLLFCLFRPQIAFLRRTISKIVYKPLKLAKIGELYDVEDQEDIESFKKIASNYLTAKFQDCIGDDCTFSRERKEVEDLLRSVLPPLDKEQFSREIDNVLSNIPVDADGSIDASSYCDAVISNNYWVSAGMFVVKELILLDCLHSFYFKKKNLLSDDDYNELKEQLTWEGSAVTTLKGPEALFITAVASNLRGYNIMDDVEYESLKKSLQESSSWVVKRESDPLEKMGIPTFMSYLHKSLAS